MRNLTKQFAVVFFTGFIGMILALGFGGLTGNIVSANPTLVSIRFLSIGLMLSGLTLWICLLRDEAGKPGLNTLLVFLIAAGVATLVVRLVFQQFLSLEFLNWAGLGLAVAGLVMGVFAMLVSPAMPKPLTARWPEGGDTTDSNSSAVHH